MIYNMTTPSDKIGFAEAEALKRRERLLKLKKQVEKRQNGDESEEQGSQSPRYLLNHIITIYLFNNIVQHFDVFLNSNLSDTGSQNDITETTEAGHEQPTTKSSILDEELVSITFYHDNPLFTTISITLLFAGFEPISSQKNRLGLET